MHLWLARPAGCGLASSPMSSYQPALVPVGLSGSSCIGTAKMHLSLARSVGRSAAVLLHTARGCQLRKP